MIRSTPHSCDINSVVQHINTTPQSFPCKNEVLGFARSLCLPSYLCAAWLFCFSVMCNSFNLMFKYWTYCIFLMYILSWVYLTLKVLAKKEIHIVTLRMSLIWVILSRNVMCVFAEMHHLEIWPQTWRLSRPVEKRLWYDIVHMRNHIQHKIKPSDLLY